MKSHQEQLKKTMMHLYAQQYGTQEHHALSAEKKRKRTWLGVLSLAGAGSLAGIAILTMTLTTTQPKVVTAEQLLTDASNQLDIVNQLKDDEVYSVTVKEIETQLGEIYDDTGTRITPEPIVTKEQHWTDGTLYRRDRHAPEGQIINSALWVMDDATHGTEWYWQEEYENEYMGQQEHLIKQSFSDYPVEASILDTTAPILALLPSADSNAETENALEEEWNTDFTITGEEEIEGVATYRLTGYTLGTEAFSPKMDVQQIQETMITRHYWISKDGHRLVKKETIIPDHARYETYYSAGEITNETEKLHFDEWKKEFHIDENDLNNAVAFPEIYLTPENQQKDIEQRIKDAEPRKLEACQEVTGKSEEECKKHDTIKRNTLHAWEECAEKENDIQTCNEQLATALQNQETFMSFCEIPIAQCQQLYDVWKAQGFKNTP